MYGENEQRDLWAYELNFKTAERKNYFSYLGVITKGTIYFIFLDNCAYGMAELLEMAWTDDIG